MNQVLLARFLHLILLFFLWTSGPAVGQSVTDVDGNEYPTVVIGSLEWMSQNLRTNHYNNGDIIPHIVENGIWATTQEGGWSWYNHNEGYDALYGKLYNGHVVLDDRNVCPQGWHIPTDLQWREMLYGLCETTDCDEVWLQNEPAAAYIGTDEGGKIKTTNYWQSPNIGSTNSSGLSVLPGGYRYFDGYYYTFGFYTNIWSSTMHTNENNLWFWAPINNRADIYHGYGDLNNGQSIRCVRDATTGMNDLQKTKLKVYPNPGREVLHFSFHQGRDYYITIYNSVGKLVRREIHTTPEISIDVVDFPNGLYHIEVRFNNTVQTVKWVKN